MRTQAIGAWARAGLPCAAPLPRYATRGQSREDENSAMDAFDAIVVGAGHNGLAAAIHLLSRGWSVALVEQAAEAGGAVKTREVTAPGFRHHLCAMNLSLFAGSPFLPPMGRSSGARPRLRARRRLFRERLSRSHLSRREQGSRDDGQRDCRAVGEGRRGVAGDVRPLRRGCAAPFRAPRRPMPSFARRAPSVVRMARQGNVRAPRSRRLRWRARAISSTRTSMPRSRR